MLKAIPAERTLIMNLRSDSNANAGDNYANRPWLYCTVINFGGQHLLRGGLEKTLINPYECLKGGENTIVGIGLMPEAVENGEVFFDIIAQNAVQSQKPSLDEFLKKYIQLHYGSSHKDLKNAWKILADKIYIQDDICSSYESAYLACPSLLVDRVANCGDHAEDRYPVELIEICELFTKHYEECEDSESFRFDYVDTVRQTSANFVWHLVYKMQENFHANVQKQARDYGKTQAEKDWFDYQMKTLITVWGDERTWNRPDACHRLEGLLDNYAAREYGDLMHDYYRPRWERYITMLEFSLFTDKPFEEYNFAANNALFCYSRTKYPSRSQGDTLKIANQILEIIKNNAEAF